MENELFKTTGLFFLAIIFVSILFPSPIYAWPEFLKFSIKPKGGMAEVKPYQVEGEFDVESLVTAMKIGHEKCRPLLTSAVLKRKGPERKQIHLNIYQGGIVSGQGEIGDIDLSWWVAGEYGDMLDVYLKDKYNFSFHGSDDGQGLTGQVDVVYETLYGGTNRYQARQWSASRKDGQLEGIIYDFVANGEEELDLAFSAQVDETLPDEELKPKVEHTLNLVGIHGYSVVTGKAKIFFKDGSSEEVDIKDGQLIYDPGLVKKIVISDSLDSKRKLSLQGVYLWQGIAMMAGEEEWLEYLKSELQDIAKIFNQSQEFDLDEYFVIDSKTRDNEHQPPWYDFLRKFGWKDKIKFDGEALAWTGDVNTAIHEIVGHAFTEVIGEGNKLKYAGGGHEDPWRPIVKERSIFNPLSWFGRKYAAYSDDKARGIAFSEGWAQYVGDKFDRELKGIPDGESELTTDNAREAIKGGQKKPDGKACGSVGYGAKVENVVATVFNEIYKGKTIKEVIEDFVKMRTEYKKTYGRNWQNINDLLEQKLAWTDDPQEKKRIKELIYKLSLERYPQRQDYESDQKYEKSLDKLNQRDSKN